MDEALFLQDVCKGYARRSHKYMDTFASLYIFTLAKVKSQRQRAKGGSPREVP